MVTPADNNYAPPQSVVADVAAEDGALASRGERLGASIIDGLVYAIPFIPSYLMILPAAGHPNRNPLGIWGLLATTGVRFYAAAAVVIGISIINALLVHKNAQTIGKKMVGIKVARKNGSRATLARIFFLRYLLNSAIYYGIYFVIPLLGSLYVTVDALFIFGNARRCVHDYLADTIVIKA